MSDSSMMRGAPAQRLDRDELIQAGVWAAPALVFATAAPDVAVSGSWRAQVIGVPELTAVSSTPGSLDVRLRLEYAFDGWWAPGRPPSGAPLSAILNWRITAVHEDVGSLLGIGAQSVVSSSSTDVVTYSETDFEPGTYTVQLEATATFPADTSDAVFVAEPRFAQLRVDVA